MNSDPLMTDLAIPPRSDVLSGARGSPIVQGDGETTLLEFTVEVPKGANLARISVGAIETDPTPGSTRFANVAPIGSGLSTGEIQRVARTITGENARAFHPVAINGTTHPIKLTTQHQKIED